MPAVPKKAGKNSNGAATAVKLPPYEPNIPEPTTRADLMKYWMPLSLDDKTAQKLLWITESGTKVARTADDRTCPYPAKPERYEHSPQVLSKEGLLGSRGYWEVDYQGWVVIGVAYESSARKDGSSGLGENDSSWGAGWAGTCFQVWHNAESVEVDIPMKTKMGVYVDQPAGIIKFFTVEGESEGEQEVRLIHKYKNNFKDKLLPGLWIGTNSFCQFRKNNQ